MMKTISNMTKSCWRRKNLPLLNVEASFRSKEFHTRGRNFLFNNTMSGIKSSVTLAIGSLAFMLRLQLQ